MADRRDSFIEKVIPRSIRILENENPTIELQNVASDSKKAREQQMAVEGETTKREITEREVRRRGFKEVCKRKRKTEISARKQ